MRRSDCRERVKSYAGKTREDHLNAWNRLRISLHPDWPIEHWLFQQANHGANSDPGTQLGTQTRILALFRREFGPCYDFYILFKTFVSNLINFIGQNGSYWVASSYVNPTGFLLKTEFK